MILIPINKKSVKQNPNYLKREHIAYTGNITVKIEVVTKHDEEFIRNNRDNGRLRNLTYDPIYPSTGIMSVMFRYYGPRSPVELNLNRIHKLLMKHISNDFVKYPKFLKLNELCKDFVIELISVNKHCMATISQDNEISF